MSQGFVGLMQLLLMEVLGELVRPEMQKKKEFSGSKIDARDTEKGNG